MMSTFTYRGTGRTSLRRYCSLLCGAAVLIFLAGGLLFRIAPAPALADAPVDMVSRARSLCAALTGSPQPAEIVGYYNTASARRSRMTTTTLNCTAADHEYTLIFDTRSRDLLSLTQTLRPIIEDGPTYGKVDTASCAEKAGHGYLRLAGLEDADHRWLPETAPVARGNGWYLRFRHENAYACLSVRASDGALSQLTQSKP